MKTTIRSTQSSTKEFEPVEQQLTFMETDDKLQKHMLRTYFTLRFGMGCIAFVLPFVLWLGGMLVLDLSLLGSMSAYYYTPMRNIFVGTLCAIGAFLFLYKGYSKWESWLLNAAGLFAIGVALLPTAPDDVECEVLTPCFLHGVSAVLLFLAIAYVCIFMARKTLKLIQDERMRRLLDGVYWLLGLAMVGLPLSAAFVLNVYGQSTTVFWMEFFAILVFATYWIIKGLELHRTSSDQKALAEAYRAHPVHKA